MLKHRTIVEMPMNAEFLLTPVMNKNITLACILIEKNPHKRMKNAGIIPKPIFGHMVLENGLVLRNLFQMWFHPCLGKAAVFKSLERVRMQLCLIRKQSMIKTLSFQRSDNTFCF